MDFLWKSKKSGEIQEIRGKSKILIISKIKRIVFPDFLYFIREEVIANPAQRDPQLNSEVSPPLNPRGHSAKLQGPCRLQMKPPYFSHLIPALPKRLNFFTLINNSTTPPEKMETFSHLIQQPS